MLPGRRCSDAVWRSQVKAKAHDEKCILELNHDVAKCFENVSWVKLKEKAFVMKFPTSLLRVSLSSYGWARRLSWKQLISGEVRASRGVVAGSGFAIFELVLFMVQDANEIEECSPGVQLQIHVDDITLTRPPC